MASSMEPGGEQPISENDLDDFDDIIEIVPEESIENLSTENDTSPVLANMTNVLTLEEEVNITIPNTEEESKPLTPWPNLLCDEDTSSITFQDLFTPIDVVNVDQSVPATPRHAALFTHDAELSTEDPMQTWPYAMDVFIYQKEREKLFIIKDYMPNQPELTPWNRRLLISWMVTVHQSFGTFRETFFLAVKIVDIYMSRFLVGESMLELLGATALNIASKYEEKVVLTSYSLLQQCYCAYTTGDLVQMEKNTLSGINFDLGIPIAYRFLRRYARSAKVPDAIWTLASYILELNVLEYSTVGHSDSQVAAAALFMALRMCGGQAGHLDEHTWSPTLVHYSGYELPEFAWLVPLLNAILHGSYCDTCKDVRNLYSAPVLYRVVNVPHLTDAELFLHNPELYTASP